VPSFQDFAKKALDVLGLGNGKDSAAANNAASLGSAADGQGRQDSPETSWVRFEAHGPQWGFAFWGLSPADRQALSAQPGPVLSLRIADVTGLEPDQPPHALQELRVDARAEQWGVALPLGNRIYRTKLGRGSEEFHELEGLEEGGLSLSDSGLGLWASGRNESGSGLVARQRSFWLVADAELIVYGATEPTATLMIGDQVVPLAADGSFRIQVPFRDGQQLYPIEAISADGEQRRSIVMEFARTTPEDRTNPASTAAAEWF